MFYFSCVENWGDLVGPYIVNKITGRPIVKSHFGARRHLIAVGSVLSEANSNSIVWGSGFISTDSRSISSPKSIHAVRGPKTRDLLLKQSISCPERYGDPALLLPLYYTPNIESDDSIGVILHYTHKKYYKYFAENPRYKAIDIDTSDIEGFVRSIKSCKGIISSSLHGLIAADAYKVPNTWLEFDEQLKGGRFKFHDYFDGIGAKDRKPILFNTTTPPSLRTLEDSLQHSHIEERFIELLLESFPKEIDA